MKLMHFSNASAITVESRSLQRDGMKPSGFWVSDEDDHGWSSWCHGETYDIGSNAYEVDLADGANVLTLSTAAAVVGFHAAYGATDPCYVDWARVANRWQGFLITPYQWDLRLSDVRWYYSWDCASGCIWDASAVGSIALVGETRQAVS